MKLRSFIGPQIAEYIPSLARLRIEVFRDFPYLYEGSLDYEKKYLQIYPQSQKSVMVGAFDHNNELVGASTGMPLSDETDYIQEPFKKTGHNTDEIYYFAESVLLKGFRGQGLGHRFFEGREKVARENGYKMVVFCAVVRPNNHPMKPHDYHPLDEFWIKCGFSRHSELQSEFSWRDIGDSADSKKQMVYWLKKLN